MDINAKKVIDQTLNSMGVYEIKKDIDGPITTAMSTSQFMNMTQVKDLVDRTMDVSQWTKDIRTEIVAAGSGEIPAIAYTGPVWEFLTAGSAKDVSAEPSYSSIPYACRHGKASFSLTQDAIDEANASGTADLQGKVQQAFFKALNNSWANAIINGNKSLDSSTKLNRSLNAINGLKVKALTGNVRMTVDPVGKEFDLNVYYAMRDSLPDGYLNESSMAWFVNPRIEMAWRRNVSNSDTTDRVRSALGDQALTSLSVPSPLGYPQIKVPQIGATDGSTAIAPTSVTSTSSVVNARCHALLDDATSYTGRRVRITLKATGVSEVCTVFRTSSQNWITCTTALGQVTISTTASDYEINFADWTRMYYSDPLNLVWVVRNKVRSYRTFDEETEIYKVTVHADVDFLIENPEAVVVQKGIIIPTYDF
jgi:hypothetical protein